MDTAILVVDDDDAVRRILRKVLESKPYRVVDSGQPVRACELFDSDRPTFSLLVTDIKMPMMNGQQVAAHLWKSRPELPVLFISGYTDQAYAQELHGPRSRFLEKPFTSDALLEVVAQLLAASTGG